MDSILLNRIVMSIHCRPDIVPGILDRRTRHRHPCPDSPKEVTDRKTNILQDNVLCEASGNGQRDGWISEDGTVRFGYPGRLPAGGAGLRKPPTHCCAWQASPSLLVLQSSPW